jgi:prevent-host-death family protein
MTTIGAFEAKNTLGTLLDRVESGEEIIITRHGKAVARLVPNTRRVDQDQARAAFERIRNRAQRLKKSKSKPATFDWPTLKQLRDQGRP